MSDVTKIISAIESGDTREADKLLPLVYDELRRLASAKLAKEKPGQTIQPTMLVHEAYLRLVDKNQQQNWNSCRHFFGAAAEAMRRILIENARRKKRQKRAAVIEHNEMDAIADPTSRSSIDLLALDEALATFETKWPDKAALVKLKYFAGLTVPESAEALGISVATAERQWAFAKTWLHVRLSDRDAD